MKDETRTTGPTGDRTGDRGARRELLEAMEHLRKAVGLLLEQTAGRGSARAPTPTATVGSTKEAQAKADPMVDRRMRDLALEFGRLARHLRQVAGVPPPEPPEPAPEDLAERRSRNADCMD